MKKEDDDPEPIKFYEDTDKQPWLRFLPDFTKLPKTARLALVVLLLVAVGSVLGWCSPRVASGSPLDCEGIHNADRRHFCRAVSIPRKSECEFIKDKELRYECRARVK